MESFTQSSFFQLTPDKVLSALESHGYLTTGRYRTLNSYENRVFDIELEPNDNTTFNESSNIASNPTFKVNPNTTPPGASELIVKFYRPHRWSEQAILEEHQFLLELQAEGLPVAAPLALPQKSGYKKSPSTSTLWNHEGLWMAVFPKIRGRMVEEILPHQAPHLGRWLARLHNVGAKRKSQFRPALAPDIRRVDFLKPHIPIELWNHYLQLAEEIFTFLTEALPRFTFIRVHGDFHRGNLLWDKDWTLIDFDDHLMAPAAQDLWLILTQLNPEDQTIFINSYQELREWDEEEHYLLEPLRAYRIIYYSTWVAERWSDPSFPHLFPNFRDYNFWSNEILQLQKILES